MSDKTITIEDFLNKKIDLGSDNPLLNGEDFLVKLLGLPEETFKTFAPYTLQILEETYNKPEIKGILIKKFKDIPIASVEDFKKTLIDSNEDSLISDQKLEFLTNCYNILYNIILEAKEEEHISMAIEKCHPDAVLPTYSNSTDAGMDVYAIEDITINPGETKLIKTGIKVAIPKGYEIQVRPRSGQSLKTKLRVANAPGTIDAGYREELGIIIENIESPIQDIQFHYNDEGKLTIDSISVGRPYEIVKGQRIAQLIVSKTYHADFYKVNDIKAIKGDRGGGFGSTGK